jgi:hypothetical protein
VRRRHGKVVDCSGVQATWCPIHGDCSCVQIDAWLTPMTGGPDTMQVGEYEFHTDGCPLHDDLSRHPLEVHDAPIERFELAAFSHESEQT